MIAKDKAKELVEKMFNVDLNCPNESMCMLYPHAKLCALIAVEEMIEVTYAATRSTYEYWLDVKSEIEKL